MSAPTVELDGRDQPLAAEDASDGAPTSAAPKPRPLRRHPALRWLLAIAGVVGLLLVTLLAFDRQVTSQQDYDPRSTSRLGTGALATLLREEGVRIDVVDSVPRAIDQVTAATTLVVVHPERLSADDAAALRAAAPARLVLHRPSATALTAFELPATRAAGAQGVQLSPDCALPATDLAKTVTVGVGPHTYRPRGTPDFACYPTGADGYVYLGVDGVHLVAGGITNTELGIDGNAAFAMNVLGSQPDLVWLMATESAGPASPAPTLLPQWWQVALAQAFVTLIVLAVWRGRRFGPIITERLPVTVRAAETAIGHGRLYQRLEARDRAAAALRTGARSRLARLYGHSDDPLALSSAVAARTGRDPTDVRRVLDGPDPVTDDQLIALARDLDRLEQEARQL